MKGILDKVVNDQRFDTVEDSIIENCCTYGDYGELLAELLSYFGESGHYEEQVTDILESMTLDYMAEVAQR